ncbi:MAG: ABC transporter permease [Nitrosopumilus sp.]|nr:ABC transporter permease [Nitrosopumilus sp.]
MNIKMRYKGTYLGLLWSVLEPLFIFLILYVVFTSIKDVSKQDDFAIYLIFGVFLYHLFIRGSMNGLVSLKVNSNILTFMNIQKEFFPVVNTGSVLLLMFVQLTVFFILVPIFNFSLSWTIVFLPFLMALFLTLVLGISYILSITYVFFKDIHPIWGVLTYSLIFISPVFWYIQDANGILLEIHKINPLGQLIELGHKIIFGIVPTFEEWIYTTSIVFGILFLGYTIFQKYENKVSEKL